MIPWPPIAKCRFLFAALLSFGGAVAHSQQQPSLTEITPGGRISWTSEANVSYQLQKTIQLGSGVWGGVGAVVPGNGGIVSVTDSAQSSAQAFYRVVATNNTACTNGGGTVCDGAIPIGSVSGDTSP